MSGQTQAFLAFAVTVAAAIYLLPTTIAVARRAEARVEVILLNVFLGWTGAVWAAALLLALGPRAPQRTPGSRRVGERSDEQSRVYLDGWYILSSGPESSTWAVCQGGCWRIVYELDGRQRLVGTVSDRDIPMAVRADALAGIPERR